MSKPPDFYKVLGVEPDATEKEIMDAHRKLIKQCHPDLVSGKIDMFNEIQQAYEVLIDPESRKLYDESGEVREMSPESKIKLYSRNNIIQLFDMYISKIKTRKDLIGKNILKDLNKQVKVSENQLHKFLNSEQHKLDALKILIGRFKNKKKTNTFFEKIIMSKVEEIQKNIKNINFDLDVRKAMKKLLSTFTYDTFLEQLLELGQTVYEHHTFDMSPDPKKEDKQDGKGKNED